VDIPLTAKPSYGAGNGGTAGFGNGMEGAHPRYDYEQQQKQRQAAEWAAQRRQYEAAQRGRPAEAAYSPRGEHAHEHQQWDAQGRAVGYTPGPGGAVMYAPQPTRGFSGSDVVGAASGSGGGAGRTPIQADSVYHAPGTAEVYAHGRAPAGREATGDEVGWDMQAQQMRQRSPPQQQQHQYTTSPPQQQPQRQYTGQQQQQQQQPQRQYTGQQQHVEPGTPTQAQYATYQVPPSAASTTLAYLRSPFDDPSECFCVLRFEL
jgi:hypothetical protein